MNNYIVTNRFNEKGTNMKNRKRILKKLVIAVITFAALTVPLAAQTGDESPKPVTFGIHLLGGGRYDDVRMCVGSPPGVPGGPIGEIYLDLRFAVGKNGHIALNMPIFRPILFGLVHQMLQFEPQATYEYTFPTGTKVQPVVGGGLGLVFHYGPDIYSSPADRGDSFFSMGPLFTGSAGLKFGNGHWIAGIKVFYSPLFSTAHSTGTVAGGGVEVHYLF